MPRLPKWVVLSVTPRHDYTLLLTFAGYVKNVYDAKPLLEDSYYAPLKNLNFFMQAHTDTQRAWAGDLDIAPEHLYETSTPLHE